MNTEAPPRLLKTAEVIRRTGLSRSGIAKAERAGTFPQRIKITAKSAAWLESEVSAWIAERAKNSRFTLRGSRRAASGEVAP